MSFDGDSDVFARITRQKLFVIAVYPDMISSDFCLGNSQIKNHHVELGERLDGCPSDKNVTMLIALADKFSAMLRVTQMIQIPFESTVNDKNIGITCIALTPITTQL